MRNEWVSEWCEALWLRFGDPTLSLRLFRGRGVRLRFLEPFSELPGRSQLVIVRALVSEKQTVHLSPMCLFCSNFVTIEHLVALYSSTLANAGH
jgi:hypothetical protein